ncbi:DUF58 domain-containing protein [Arthrobacter sp. zg-Y1116]|uniref:DUF58 domain-containing protein n=1 Tax=Arthrobacter sp. zg-Y1116 TaxID=2964611 RepID=UPI0021067E7F|nr:DUF58 domain-containing protein [Arthrobacter sp. zg-Y1116]MCQ1947898.1 DUF58 domain-containing protein [Arthrobacter sp. zg-Y1116]
MPKFSGRTGRWSRRAAVGLRRRALRVRRAVLRSAYWRAAAPKLAPAARRLGPVLERTGAGLGSAGRRLRAAMAAVSPLGWLAVGLTFVLVLLGTVFNWQEALVAAVGSGVLLVLGTAFVVGRLSYDVALDLARTRVAVGDAAVGSLSITSTAARSMLPVTFELPVGGAVAAFDLPRMRPGHTHEELFSIPTRRRAVIKVGPVESVRQDPLRLMGRRLIWADPVDLYVHPRTVSLSGSTTGFIRDLEGEPTTDLSSSDVAFHALRAYVPGDDRRHIHWKTTARTGTLMVRQFEETRRSHVAVALSLSSAEYTSEEDLELAVSVAGSLGVQAFREQLALSVLTQDGPLRCTTAGAMLDGLTEAEGKSRTSGIVDLARITADAVPNASVVFLVTGTEPNGAALRSASMKVPPGIRCIALRCGTGLEPALAAIGDLAVLDIGDLESLPGVLRKAVA